MRTAILNLCLVVLAAVLGYSLYDLWAAPPAQLLSPPSGSQRPPRPAPIFSFRRPMRPQRDYLPIVEQNLFHPARKAPVSPQLPKPADKGKDEKPDGEQSGTQVAKIVAPKQGKKLELSDLQLFGTLIFGDDVRYALFGVSAPRRAQARQRGRRRTPQARRAFRHYKVGDKLGGFHIVEILRDRVVLESGEKEGERSTLLVRDPTKPKVRPKPPRKKARPARAKKPSAQRKRPVSAAKKTLVKPAKK